MKTYIVYVNGVEQGYIKAANHNAAEKKAIKKYNGKPISKEFPVNNVSVAYTEI